ncbi:hypothetical protein Poli38472_010849 [Pythium oligandrum]|uniref:FYVE-type domain-containing protein n=1 Tax=Pythium oligandrum TaxID=41045 RepID=A0A8K1FGL3_PYTOL|nr:hypothetical protein Poli38472_010849 [Pythium oligandrum]|eukprot:TMW61786.1 hypothetical protein Poli38472_010849 [Pythium oligandrum]
MPYHRSESSRPQSASTASSLSPRSVLGASQYHRNQSSSFHLDHELIEIPRHKQQDMLDKVNVTVKHVLESMVGDRPSTVYWKPKMQKKGVSYYVDENVNPGQYRFCCVSDTQAPAEEVMRLFLMTDTDTLLKNYRICYNNVLDARVLSVLQHPDRKNPMKSVYIRYSSFATPALMDNRDMSVVVATDLFQHVDGSTVAYCLWDSVELAEIPEVPGLTRSRMFRSGFFMRTSTNEEGVPSTKIVYLVGLEAGGIAPRLASKMVIEKFGANLGRVCEHFRRKNLDPTTFLPRSQWASRGSAKFCRSCLKNFHSLSKRSNCACCGEVICASCIAKENVDLPGVGITAMRFCYDCLGSRGVARSPQNGAATTRNRGRSHSQTQTQRTEYESVDSEMMPSHRPQVFV